MHEDRRDIPATCHLCDEPTVMVVNCEIGLCTRHVDAGLSHVVHEVRRGIATHAENDEDHVVMIEVGCGERIDDDYDDADEVIDDLEAKYRAGEDRGYRLR